MFSPIQSLMNEKHPLAFILLLPLVILFVRMLLRWVAFLNRFLFTGTTSLSPGLCMPRRVLGCAHPYGVVELKGRRPYMEDRHVVVPNLLNNGSLTLYGVFDGHGGAAAAQFCCDHLGPLLTEAENKQHLIKRPQTALSHAFKTIDKRFLELANLRKMDDGTTAIVAMCNGKHWTIANAGDSRAIMVQKSGRTMPLSRDHKPDRSDERDRIARLGGSVIHFGVWRVEGILAVSRAIGDRLLKEYVIPDPEFVSWTCSPDDKYLIIATDGLWDVIDNDQVGRLALDCKNAQVAAELLTHQAFIQGTMDNVTVLVIDVRHASSQKGRVARSSSTSSTTSTSDLTVIDGSSGSISSKLRKKKH